MENDILRTHRPSKTQRSMRDVLDHEQRIRRLQSTQPHAPGGAQNGQSYSNTRANDPGKFQRRVLQTTNEVGVSHLEGVVLEQVGNTRLRLVATPSFYDNGDGGGWLSVVDGCDADAARIDHGRKTTSGDGP